MKRLMPSSLITFLQQNPNCLKADLFSIKLPTGTTLNVTEGQFDITVPSSTPGWSGGTTTFSATQYGKWFRGPITSEAGFDLSANSMKLTCVPQQGTQYPGVNIGMLGAAANGLFDACLVSVYTCYMPFGSYGNVSAGIETKFLGFMEKITSINRVKVEWDIQDPMYLLNEKTPKRIIQSACQWGFCDGNCGLNATNYTVNFTAKSGSTQSLLTPATAFSQAAGYFTQGVVTCLTGNNEGLSATVKLHDTSGNLELVAPFILSVNAGDTFTAIAGCTKTTTACAARVQANGTQVNNLVNFSGAIAVPVPLEGGM